MWSGTTDTIVQQVPKNYMYNDKVFILDEITTENCAYLLGDLSTFIFNPENMGKRLQFFINSPGGESFVMMNIIGLMNIAKLYNMSLETFVLGHVASAASLIAVHGTERLMSKVATHHLHFGTLFNITTKQTEIEKIYKQNTEYSENIRNLYLECSHGKLSPNVLDKLCEDERGILNAEQCLKYGLCDHIIEHDLDLKNQEEQARIDFEEEFQKHVKELAKLEREKKKSNKKTNKAKKKVSKKDE